MSIQLISYEDAIETGAKIYHTGKPCKHGHTVGYWVSYRHCVLCDAIKRNINKVKKRVDSVSRLPSWYGDEEQLIREIYKKCAEMSRENEDIYHVDHEVPLKHDLVCGLHTIANLQILTKFENHSKKNKFEVI